MGHGKVRPGRGGTSPEEPLVERDAFALKKCPVFFLERLPSMMFSLTADVPGYRLNLRSADGERTVALLPREL
jgi:hypothetical protein